MLQDSRSDLLSPAFGRSTAEVIVRRLSEGITTGVFAPGERLPTEEELARSFGVATMTLRQALLVLRELDLVETRRGRNGGSYVRKDVAERLAKAASLHRISLPELRDLTDWRRAISGEASALAAERGTAADLAAISDASVAFRGAAQSIPHRRMADARLHSLIAEASGSRHLIESEREIQEKLTQLIMSLPDLTLVRESVGSGHDDLVQAILAREPEAARQSMITHAEQTHDWCVALLSKG